MKKILAIFVLLSAIACTPTALPGGEGASGEDKDDGQLESVPDDGQGTIYF